MSLKRTIFTRRRHLTVLPASTVARAAGTCLSKISHDHLALAVVALVLAFGLHVG